MYRATPGVCRAGGSGRADHRPVPRPDRLPGAPDPATDHLPVAAERILKLKSTVYGDIAHVLVRFDLHINGSKKPARQGVDSFQLIRQAGHWRIISITNDRPSHGVPIPDGLF